MQHGESHDFHIKQQPGEVCQETLHSVKAIRSAAEVGANIAWICPLRAVKHSGCWRMTRSSGKGRSGDRPRVWRRLGREDKFCSLSGEHSPNTVQAFPQCLDACLLLSLKFDVLEVKKRKVLQETCYLLPSKHHYQELSHLEVSPYQ